MYFLHLVYCNTRYKLFTLSKIFKHFSLIISKQLFAKNSDLDNSNELLAQEQIWLRGLLQSYPFWLEGHLKLGFIELRLYQKKEYSDRDKELASAKVSLRAIKTLVANGAKISPRALKLTDILSDLIIRS